MKRGIGQRERLRGVLHIVARAAGAAMALCIGFALVGMGLIALAAAHSEASLDPLRPGVWRSLYAIIVSQALLPPLLLSLLAWLGTARRFPPLVPGAFAWPRTASSEPAR
jgi:hypothetical protein